MGHKVNPRGFRLVVNKDWNSRWFGEGIDYGRKLLEDLKIRKFIQAHAKSAGIHKINIVRSFSRVEVVVKVAKPGVMIGRGGANFQALKEKLEDQVGSNIKVTVEEVRSPALSAKLVAEDVAGRIERRQPVRRVMRRVLDDVVSAGADGVKIRCAGVLSGPSSISRAETKISGSIPAQTLRANIDYYNAVARTGYGTIGVKVWIYKKGNG